MDVPFRRECQLNDELDLLKMEGGPSEDALKSSLRGWTLPGHPRIKLEDAAMLMQFMESELYSPLLEKLAPHLWMLSTYSSANISPLHHQRVKGRQIIVTEDPKFHLVWYHDRIFIKPLPRYLLSHRFWTTFLLHHDGRPEGRQRRVLQSALGYLRTYFYLIKHESDFHIAQQASLSLIPASVSWKQFSDFVSCFDLIDDSAVTARYSYGELRLTRLNFYGKIFLRQFQFEYLVGQYSTFFSEYFTPLLFAFAALSIILNTMQVEMAVESVISSKWEPFWRFCRGFSVASLVLVFLSVLGLFSLLLGLLANEWVYAIRMMRRKRRTIRASNQAAGEMT